MLSSYSACLAQLSAVVSFEYGQCLIEDANTLDYRVVTAILPEGKHGYEIAHRTGVIGQVFRTEKAILVSEVQSHPLYDAFDRRIEWELCFPLRLQGQVRAVINLEGSGLLEMNDDKWRRIGATVFETTQTEIEHTLPQPNDSWRLRTKRVILSSDPDDQENHILLTVARALARTGESTLLVGECPAVSRRSHPTMDEADENGLALSECFVAIEKHLDMLATGPKSRRLLSKRTNWWDYCWGRYSFVVTGNS